MPKPSKDPLGDRVRSYESVSNYTLTPESHRVFRLDGRGFSKLTKQIGAEKPFDAKFSEKMCSVAKRLITEYPLKLAYTQSDEITLIPTHEFFSGRIQKLTSVLAGEASGFLSVLLRTPVVFDCRVFEVPSEVEIWNCLVWRQRDALKNAANLLGQVFLGQQEVYGVPAKKILELVREKHGKGLEDYPLAFSLGTFFKKRDVVSLITNGDPYVRTGVTEFSRRLEFSEENLRNLLADRWGLGDF